MLQAAICDNEELFTQKMKTLLADCLKGYELDAQIETFASAQAFLQACQTKRYDFVFLDVELDEASGMDVACEMRKTNPDAILVFASGFVKYAVQGYKVRAFRYLLKQELEEEFPICMKEVLQEIKRQRQTMSIKTVDGAAVSVRLSDIWYLEGKNHNVCVCTAGGDYLVHDTLNHLCAQIPSEDFMRIQRSFCVNMRNVVQVKGNTVQLANKTVLTASRHAGPELMRRFLQIQGEC